MDRQTVGWMDGRMDRQMVGWVDGRTDGWLVGWVDGRTDGRLVGWLTDGRMDGWMDGCCCLKPLYSTVINNMLQMLFFELNSYCILAGNH